ncbi:MAG: alpha/beta fold hydrolase [Alphaproteobacteria bacterium]
MKSVLGYLIKITLVFVVVYVAVTAFMYFFQRRLTYLPDTTRYSPAQHRLSGVTEVILDTSDGEHIIAWYLPAKPGKPTLLYFHGNGGGLLTRSDRFKLFQDVGYGVFMPSYRGYSGSTGSPSEKANIADATLAYNHLIKLGIPPERIVLYGESLGTGVAVQTAAAHRVGALVLDSPYTSLVDVAKLSYRFLLVDTLMADRYESKAYIGRVHVPLLIMHGERDVVVPPKFSAELFKMANEPKKRVTFPKAGHSDIHYFGAFATLQRFVNTHLK